MPPIRRSAARPRSAADSRPVKVVIFYESFSDAARVDENFDRIAGILPWKRPVVVQSWNFCMLDQPALNGALLKATEHADAVVVAANGERDLPASVTDWVEACVNGNPAAKAVLVGLHDDGLEPDASDGRFCSSLRKIAERKRATFICTTDLRGCKEDAPQTNPGPRLQISRAPGAKAPMSSHMEVHRWWGINE